MGYSRIGTEVLTRVCSARLDEENYKVLERAAQLRQVRRNTIVRELITDFCINFKEILLQTETPETPSSN